MMAGQPPFIDEDPMGIYQQILVPGGCINLKTDSSDLYQFTKKVIALYNCTIHKDLNNVFKEENISEELKINTHYESLDIAGTKRIHYLCFSLPENLPGKEKDDELKKLLKGHEGVD